MMQSGNEGATESDVTSPDVEQVLCFDDETLKAVAEVCNDEGKKAYNHKDYSNAIYFYTEGIKVNCKDDDLKAELYCNRAAAHLSLENYNDSLRDANDAMEIRPLLIKTIITGANALFKLNLVEQTIMWCKKGLAIEMENITLLELSKLAADKLNSGSGIGGTDHKTCQRRDGTHRLHDAKDEGQDRDTEGKEYKKIIEFHQQALSIAKENGNKDSEGNAYMKLGISYHSLGDFKKAIKFVQQGLGIAKEVGNKALEGLAYTILGKVYQSLGDFKKEIEFNQQALSIAKEIGNKALEGNAYGNLGNVYHSLGDFKKAIEFHQQDLNIAKEIGNKASEGNAYGNLGNAYNSLGDFKTAIEFHQQALSTAKEIGNKASEVCAYGNLGNAYKSLGEFKKEIEFNQQALSIAKEIGNKESEGKAYGNLGDAYRSLGDFEKAIEFQQQGLSIAKEIGNKDSEGIACGNLGIAYQSLGDFKEAIKLHLQALSIAKEILNRALEGKAYVHLGIGYYSLGDFKKAIDFLEGALRIGKEIRSRYLEEAAYSWLGLSFFALGHYPQAEKFLQSSTKVLEEMRLLLQEKDEWKIGFRDQSKVYNNLCTVQLEQGKTDDALFTAERGRAQALADLMKSQYGMKSTLQEQIEKITNTSSHISSTTAFLARGSKSMMLWVLLKGGEWQFMRTQEFKYDYTLEDLTNKAYTQIGLDKRARCEDRSLDDPVDEKVEELSDWGTDKKESTSSQDECDPLKVLYEVVIDPISHLIEGDELIIVPDGSSFLIPYAALRDQSSRYLSETLRIRLAPSLTSLRLLTDCPDGRHCTSGALLVGDPWIETVRLKREGKIRKFPQLPGAEEEVKVIGQILNVEPLTGKNATKDQVLSRLSSVSLVHIAAHGCAETGEIILSPNLPSSKRPKEKEFLLTMEDVLNAKLRAKLVILSCCHSGQGKIRAEGVVGIARAFLGAGARSIIASLWAIDDEATLEFMRQFYDHLVKGQSASKSLHQAMKWMRESDDFKAVKYWAPFMLIGDDVTLNFDQ